jgi:hypothetical protein
MPLQHNKQAGGLLTFSQDNLSRPKVTPLHTMADILERLIVKRCEKWNAPQLFAGCHTSYYKPDFSETS